MIRTIGVLVIFATLPALAKDPNIDPNRSVYGYCILCHGIDGRGSEPVAAPRIGGMPAWYLERQLIGFRNGWRGTHADDLYGSEMRTMALVLKDQAAVKQVAAYFAAYEPPPVVHTVEGDAAHGRAVFATCISCHGSAAEGNRELNAPALTGQSDWYLVTQLNHFRLGLRGTEPQDEAGTQMRAAAESLPDEQSVRDVIAYINSLE